MQVNAASTLEIKYVDRQADVLRTREYIPTSLSAKVDIIKFNQTERYRFAVRELAPGEMLCESVARIERYAMNNTSAGSIGREMFDFQFKGKMFF